MQLAGVADAMGGVGPLPQLVVVVGVRSREPDALAALFEFGFDRVYSLAARLLGEGQEQPPLS